MRISLRLQALGFRRVLLGPNLRPTQEETLLGSEAIDVTRVRLTLERLHESVVGHVKSAKVRDRFTRDELALQVQTRFNFKTIKLLNNTVGAFIEALLVAFGPPVFQITQ